MKKIINKIHLWLGLAVGLIIVVVSITGCLYAFEAEIQDMTQPYRHVKAEQKQELRPSVLAEIAIKALPGKHVHSVEYGKPEDAARVSFYNSDPEYYYVVYLNPYSGEVLEAKDMDSGFFRFVLMGHYYLWLPPTVGQPIVATATLIFVVMLITGIILWWPKNKAAAKQRFSIKWSARWRRKNYDLHNVLGFYACWVAIFLAITGLVWGFEWFSDAVYWTTSGGKARVPYSETFSDTTKIIKPDAPAIDLVWQKLRKEHPGAELIEVHIPEDHRSAIGGSANRDGSTYWQTDYRYFDQYNLKELSVEHTYGRYNSTLPAAEKIARMNYDIHVGAVLGLPGKFLAFFASLICASLPVTGFMIWWGRKNKTKK